MQPVATQQNEEAPVAAKPRPRRGQRAYLLIALLTALGLAGFGGYAYVTRNIETTDDAQIEADVVPMSPRVGGQIVRVAVADDQTVKAGELLIEVDPAPYQARLEQAEAGLSIAQANVTAAEADATIVLANSEGGLAAARAGVTNAELSISGANAQVAAAEAAVERATAQAQKVDADLERARQLSGSGVVPETELEHREREADISHAQLKEVKAQLTVARDQARAARTRVSETKGRLRQNQPVDAQGNRSKAQLELARARVKSAQAAVELARFDLAGTRVVAPGAGRVTRLVARVGQLVQPGQLLAQFVPKDRYVVANFKETQVGRVHPDQAVDVEVDAYPGRSFSGKIASIAAGTGSRFSLLPADNATGNFVKVVQRVPVHIVWDGSPPDVVLEPGMSVVVRAHVR